MEDEDTSGFWYYEQQLLGYNYRLSDIHCALGLSQLKKLDFFLKRRREIAAKYHDAFCRHPLLMVPPQPAVHDSRYETLNAAFRTVSAWHLYILRVRGDKPDRRRVVESLRKWGSASGALPSGLSASHYRKLATGRGCAPG